ncbi:MAG: hypothetical protein LUG66_11190 [Clostridiales bacterium]|nr:hypothetical protein [Clostridiales bacterium]
MEEKRLGLPSVISTSVGLIVATSCLMSLGQGAGALGTGFIISMILACAINICTALSMAELNSLMPNLTGGSCPVYFGGLRLICHNSDNGRGLYCVSGYSRFC